MERPSQAADEVSVTQAASSAHLSQDATEATSTITPFSAEVGSTAIQFSPAALQTCETSFQQSNSELIIDRDIRSYVQTQALGDAMDVLEEQGVVVLCGPPGAGKTTLGKAILRRFRNEGFTPYVLSRVEEWHNHVREGVRSVVLMDGTLGQDFLNRQQHDYWESILDSVRELTARGDCRLVLTLYPHVLRELQQLERGSRSPLLGSVVNIPGTLDRDVKEALLNFYLKESRLENDPQKIVQNEVSGPVFPWCCAQLVHRWQSSDDPTAIFTVPAEAYVPLLTRMLRDPDHGETFAAVLALTMKGLGGFLRGSRRVQPHLRELRFHDFSEYRLEEHADKLKGLFLAEDGYGFVGRVLYDAVGLALGRSFSLPVLLQVCDDQFLVDYVRTENLEFCVYVRNGDDFWHLQQRLTDSKGSMVTSLFRWRQQQPYMSDGVLKRLFALLLLPKSEDDARWRTKSFLEELNKLQWQPLKTKVKVVLPLRGPLRSNEARHQDSELKKTRLLHGVCYLDNRSLPIPVELLSIAIGEDEVIVELSSQHWNLVLRLLADREVDETDGNGNTLLHLAAETGERQIIDIAVRSGASVTFNNNKGLTPYKLAQRRREKRKHVSSSYDNSCKDLHKACREGDMTRVKVALCHSASLRDKGDNNETPLHSACCAGQLGVASLLIQLGADIHAKNAFDNTALHVACRSCHMDTIKLLVEHGADVNMKGDNGDTPLHHACQSGHVDTVILLVELGADVNMKKDDGDTPFQYACRCGHVDMVRLLVELGAGVNGKGVNGDTPLHLACQSGHVDTVRLLVELGADVNEKRIDGSTPLNRACKSGDVDTVRVLMELGADVNEKGVNGHSPLDRACQSGHVQIVRLLVEFGADVNMKGDNGDTPLHHACQSGHVQIVRLLVELGADANMKGDNGDTPLHHACQSGHVNTVRLLVELGADVNMKGDNGDTPLHHACQSGHVNTVRLLVEHGADVNVKSDGGIMPLHLASESGHVGTVRLLVELGADVNEKGVNGDTPLHCACRRGHTKVARLLLKHHAFIHTKNSLGNTALYIACEYGHTGTVELLLQNHADVDLFGDGGSKPLAAAQRYGHADIVSLLQKYCADIDHPVASGPTQCDYIDTRINDMLQCNCVVDAPTPFCHSRPHNQADTGGFLHKVVDLHGHTGSTKFDFTSLNPSGVPGLRPLASLRLYDVNGPGDLLQQLRDDTVRPAAHVSTPVAFTSFRNGTCTGQTLLCSNFDRSSCFSCKPYASTRLDNGSDTYHRPYLPRVNFDRHSCQRCRPCASTRLDDGSDTRGLPQEFRDRPNVTDAGPPAINTSFPCDTGISDRQYIYHNTLPDYACTMVDGSPQSRPNVNDARPFAINTTFPGDTGISGLRHKYNSTLTDYTCTLDDGPLQNSLTYAWNDSLLQSELGSTTRPQVFRDDDARPFATNTTFRGDTGISGLWPHYNSTLPDYKNTLDDGPLQNNPTCSLLENLLQNIVHNSTLTPSDRPLQSAFTGTLNDSPLHSAFTGTMYYSPPQSIDSTQYSHQSVVEFYLFIFVCIIISMLLFARKVR